MKVDFGLRHCPIKILDLGARAIPGELPRYKKLLRKEVCHVTAVDPDNSTNSLLLKENKNTRVLNVAAGSGTSEKLYSCKLGSCSSLIKPNISELSKYSGMVGFYEIESERVIETVRLDDMFQAETFDWLDIDIQGYELIALKHGVKLLKSVLGLQIEVSFFEKYVNQPLFGEIDTFLRGQGFNFHCFTGYGTRAPNTIKVNGSPINGINQWLWADAVYYRDPKSLPFEERSISSRKLAAIFHHLYSSYDFAAAFCMVLKPKKTLCIGII